MFKTVFKIVPVAACAALPMLVAACGGSTTSATPPSRGPSVEDVIRREAERNDGVLDSVPVRLPDGTTVIVDAVVPTDDNDLVAGYILAGEPGPGRRIVGVAAASIFGDPFVPPATPTGRFTYSGDNVAYLRRGTGEAYGRFEGTSSLTTNFDTRRASIAAGSARVGGGANAALSGNLALNVSTGAFRTDGSNAVTMTYTDGTGSISQSVGMVGALHGDNAGFSALYEPVSGTVNGVGVMTGKRD